MRVFRQVRQAAATVTMGAGSMLYTVEMLVKNDELGVTMAQMRTWLDRMGYVPVAFRLVHAQRGVALRVGFTVAAQADAFAVAFGRRLLAASRDGGVVQRDC
jgi:hypothetical protein